MFAKTGSVVVLVKSDRSRWGYQLDAFVFATFGEYDEWLLTRLASRADRSAVESGADDAAAAAAFGVTDQVEAIVRERAARLNAWLTLPVGRSVFIGTEWTPREIVSVLYWSENGVLHSGGLQGAAVLA